MFLTGYIQCVPVATYTKKDIAFYQLHQENVKNEMVVAIMLALQFHTDKSPRDLFHLKLLLAEPD